MKSIFKTGILFLGFVIGGVIFQLSCSNSDETSAPTSTNRILFTKTSGTTHTLWYCEVDGSNATEIPLNLPANTVFQWSNANTFARFSADGEQVFFVIRDYNTDNNAIYSCNLDGSNLQSVLSPPDADHILIGDIN